MIKGVTHFHLGPIWYHSEPSDVPYCPDQFLGWDFFYCFLQQTGSKCLTLMYLLFLVDSWPFGPLAHELMGSDGPDQFVVVGAMQAKLHFQF